MSKVAQTAPNPTVRMAIVREPAMPIYRYQEPKSGSGSVSKTEKNASPKPQTKNYGFKF